MLLILILLVQLLFPMGLVALLAFDRGGRAVLVLKAAITLAYLAAIARLGLWTYLPPWLPLVLAVVVVGIALLRLLRPRPQKPARRTGLRGFAGHALFATAALAGAWAGYESHATRQLPPGAPVSLAFPLEAGTYRIVNGGSRQSSNGHLKTLDPRVARYRAWRGQSFGVDIVAVDRLGMRARGWIPRDPSAYAIWNRRVLAPCAGTVVATHNNAPDMPPPQPDRMHMLGNHVLLDCDGSHVLLAHFRRGSVQVSAGQYVRIGQLLGRVGNSGNTDEPHLHVHAQAPGAARSPIAAEPRPLLLDGRHPVRNDVFVPKVVSRSPPG